MSEHSVFYDALEDTVTSIANSFDNNVPYHRFSRKYMSKEKMILKAYIKSKEEHESIDNAYHRISLVGRIKFAVIVIIAALLFAGFSLYITHYIGNMRIDEYDTHSFAFATDSENAPDILENRYEITYDLSDWDKEVLDDDQYGYFVTYRKEDAGINFLYSVKSGYQGVRYNTEGSNIERVMINGYPMIYYTTRKGVHCLTWDNGDYIFDFDFTIEYEKAIEIIESIEAV